MANFAVVTKIITHTHPTNDGDTAVINAGEDALAKAISDYLESVVDTVTIRAITVSVDNGIAYAVIVHDSP